MKIRLGYIGNPLCIEKTYTHTITYTNYIKDKNIKKIEQLITINLDNFLKTLEFNKDYDINFYRMSQNLIPLATKKEVPINYIKPYMKQWKKLGNYIKENNMRVDTHPDQFCVLNSTNPKVVHNSIEILKYNYKIYKAMNINSKTILHIGGGINNKKEAITRFKNNFQKLSTNLKKMIILENDDRIFTMKETLELCESLNIPMVLDYHHHLLNNNKEKLKDYLSRIINTWNNTNLNPKLHFSSPRTSKNKRHHSDFANYKSFLKLINILKEQQKDFDIMLECKAKEDAIFRLMRSLKYNKDIRILNKTSFIYQKKE